MAKNSKDAYGASSTTSLLGWDPEALTLVTDEKSPLYDERVHLPIDEKMVKSIMHKGVVQPISVAKHPETGEVFVVAGRQRVKNAREANRRLVEQGRDPIEVPGYTRKWVGNGAGLDEVMVIENAIRTDETPLSRARKMVAMRERSNTDDAHLAMLFGCSEATVRSTIALLDGTKALQDAVEEGTVGLGQAAKLVKLSPKEQRAKLAELVAAGEGATPRERVAKQRAVLGDKPKMKTRRQIEARLDAEPTMAERKALLWVLGRD